MLAAADNAPSATAVTCRPGYLIIRLIIRLLIHRLFSFFTAARSFHPVSFTNCAAGTALSLPFAHHAPYLRRSAMAGNIPLHCSICPKKPNFSDVSHLLTHVASKGHLSSYYKARVRATTEDESRRDIEAYDRWYAEWNVEELMSERMNQKDKRRPRPRAAGIVLTSSERPLLTYTLLQHGPRLLLELKRQSRDLPALEPP